MFNYDIGVLMRNIVSILSFLIIASSSLFSQELNLYTARDGYDTASLEAAKTIPIPKLVSVLTTTRSSFSNMENEIDTETGKSKMWIYVYRDSADITKQVALLVVDMQGLGMNVFHAKVSEILGDDSPVNFENLIPMDDWMDSPEMMANLMNEPSFSSLINSGKEYELGFSLVYDADYEFLTPERTIWGGRIDMEGSSHACAVDVESNAIVCADLTSVEIASIGGEAKVFPNPASDVITIETDGSNARAADVTVYDAFGRKVMTLDGVIIAERLDLPVSELATGAYFIVVDDGSARRSMRFTVVR